MNYPGIGGEKGLLRPFLRDPHICITEVFECASLRDLDQRSAGILVDLLAEGLKG